MEASINQSPQSSTNKVTAVYQAAQLASLGIEMGLAVLLGWFVGQWLDNRWGTDPWLMLVFTLFGVAAGFKAVLRVHHDVTRRAAKAAASESKEREE